MPPLPQASVQPQQYQVDPIVRTAAKVYLATAMAPVITFVLLAIGVVWFLRS